MSISFANGFSHAYILIALIPAMISFIVRIRSSVRKAVFRRSFENILPIKARKTLDNKDIIWKKILAYNSHNNVSVINVSSRTLKRYDWNHYDDASKTTRTENQIEDD